MTDQQLDPAPGFNDAVLYAALNERDQTIAILATLEASVDYITRHATGCNIRAEHLQGLIIWRGFNQPEGRAPSPQQIMATMKSHERVARAVGYGRLSHDDRNRINAQQRITQL